MKQKSSLRAVLCLLMALALVCSFSSAAFAADDGADLDPLLVGQWYCYDTTSDGSYDSDVFYSVNDLDIVLPNGVFTSSDLFQVASAGGYDQLTVTAADGKTDLGERLVDYILLFSEIEGMDVDEDVLDETGKLSDIEVTYEVFDLKSEEITRFTVTDDLKAELDANENDGLRIHITAKYKQDPLNTLNIDVTHSFYRDTPNYRFLEALLCGDWADQNGNEWSVSYVPEEDGDIDIAFQMTIPDGTVFNGDDLFCFSEKNDEGVTESKIQFCFEEFESPYYILGEITPESITLLADNGDLVLTRS